MFASDPTKHQKEGHEEHINPCVNLLIRAKSVKNVLFHLIYYIGEIVLKLLIIRFK